MPASTRGFRCLPRPSSVLQARHPPTCICLRDGYGTDCLRRRLPDLFRANSGYKWQWAETIGRDLCVVHPCSFIPGLFPVPSAAPTPKRRRNSVTDRCFACRMRPRPLVSSSTSRFRCIQRLSDGAWLLGSALPDNRYTRGTGNWFLSYCSSLLSAGAQFQHKENKLSFDVLNPAHESY